MTTQEGWRTRWLRALYSEPQQQPKVDGDGCFPQITVDAAKWHYCSRFFSCFADCSSPCIPRPVNVLGRPYYGGAIRHYAEELPQTPVTVV
jgi:hypothetical protein